MSRDSTHLLFGVAFGQWSAEGEERSFADIVNEVLSELVTMAGGRIG